MNMPEKIVLIRWSKYKNKVFKYLKVRGGKVLKCWESRLINDFSIHKDEDIKCFRCGNLISQNKYFRR